ncbi:MAG: methyltransferase [Ferruginibacter sp.]
MSEQQQLDAHYWDNRYETQTTGWDLGIISTPLREYFEQLTNKDQAILIPGCGNAYEAEYLLKNGFTNITVVDFSAHAVAAIKERLKEYDDRQLHVIHANFFSLQQQFDLIIEQTFFCALDPALRKDYAIKMSELLNKDGKLAGIMFNREFEGGPPFGGTSEEYQALFAPLFEIKTMSPCNNSVAPREGTEVFIILKKK